MKIIKLSPILNRGTPLIEEIKKMKKPTIETVREQYGDFGVDLFIGKENPTLIKKPNKSKNPIVNLYNKVKEHFTSKAEFEPDDTMYRIVHKYVFNEKYGLKNDVQKKFGKKGIEVLDNMELMGYIY